jgi:hypothetical protein
MYLGYLGSHPGDIRDLKFGTMSSMTRLDQMEHLGRPPLIRVRVQAAQTRNIKSFWLHVRDWNENSSSHRGSYKHQGKSGAYRHILLTAQHRSDYDKLLKTINSIPKAFPFTNDTDSIFLSSGDPPMLRRSDCPKIKFWMRSAYLDEKKARKSESAVADGDDDDDDDDDSNSDKNTMTWYVEDLDGKPVSPDTVRSIRKAARALWFRMHQRGRAPEQWRRIDSEARKLYEAEICRQFPQLSYGEGNWKANQIAQDNYSSWYKKNIKGKDAVKTEATESSTTSKRRQDALPSARLTKQRKIEATQAKSKAETHAIAENVPLPAVDKGKQREVKNDPSTVALDITSFIVSVLHIILCGLLTLQSSDSERYPIPCMCILCLRCVSWR